MDNLLKDHRCAPDCRTFPSNGNANRETFLAQTCLKAGLSPDAWQHGAQLQAFTAEVFGEL
jgi:AMMECR1 domain-containing protein